MFSMIENNSDTFGINTLNIKLFNCWVRLALGEIVYCENIPTVNTAWIFF